MDQLKLNNLSVLEKELLTGKDRIRVRKATPKDLQSIYQVACSVGNNKKEANKGFLVDDYSSNPKYYQTKLLENIFELDHFYIAESYNKVVGFLIAYTKEQWLKYNEGWIEEVYWKPDFNIKNTNDFILVDKTAILSHLTGKGIGSELYKKLIFDIKAKEIYNIFAETIISPTPNFASLSFRIKQNYALAGMRYEDYLDQVFTTLIYHKSIY